MQRRGRLQRQLELDFALARAKARTIVRLPTLNRRRFELTGLHGPSNGLIPHRERLSETYQTELWAESCLFQGEMQLRFEGRHFPGLRERTWQVSIRLRGL